MITRGDYDMICFGHCIESDIDGVSILINAVSFRSAIQDEQA